MQINSNYQQNIRLYDHPLEPNKVRSIEEQQARIKERQFYVTFLEKLEKQQIKG